MKIFLILTFTIFFVTAKSEIDSNTINRIENFTKIYNLIKFYHPSDELVNFNWDKYSAYGISEAIAAKNDAIFYKKIIESINIIAPAIQVTTNQNQFDFGKLHPKIDSSFMDTTFYQRRFGLHTLDSRYNGAITYRYKRSDYRRKYIETRSSLNVRGKKLRLIVKGRADGDTKEEVHFILSSRYKLGSKDTVDDVTISINKQVDSTYIKELYVRDSSLGIALIMYYPKSNYSLKINKIQYEVNINNTWVDIDSIIKHKKELYPTVFSMDDYVIDSSKNERTDDFETKSIFFDKLYDVSDTPIVYHTNLYKFYIPLKLRTSQTQTYPLVDSNSFITFQNDISNIKHKEIVTDISLLTKIYGHLFLDYPYIDDTFKRILSERFKSAILNRINFPNRHMELWIENEFFNYLGDPHLDIKLHLKNNFLKSSFFGTKIINNKCIVTYSLDTSILKSGDEILAINNDSINSILDRLSENKCLVQKSRYIRNYLLELHNNTDIKDYSIVLKKDSFIYKVKIVPFYKPIVRYIKNIYNYIEKINDSVVYFYPIIKSKEQSQYNQLYNISDFDTLSKFKYVIYRFHNKDKEIRDFYKYLNYDSNYLFNKSYLLHKTMNLPFNIYKYDTALRQISKFEKQHKIKKLYIYIDNEIQSSSELFLSYYINNPNVVLMGENTAGAFGTVNKIALNDEFEFNYTANKMGYSINNKFFNHQTEGIPPNLRFSLSYIVDPAIEIINKVLLDINKK